eukprot:190050-Rhodomonas_salina.2
MAHRPSRPHHFSCSCAHPFPSTSCSAAIHKSDESRRTASIDYILSTAVFVASVAEHPLSSMSHVVFCLDCIAT